MRIRIFLNISLRKQIFEKRSLDWLTDPSCKSRLLNSNETDYCKYMVETQNYN